MPHHDDAVSLRQMLDHAREASDLVKQRVRADLDQDRVLSPNPSHADPPPHWCARTSTRIEC